MKTISAILLISAVFFLGASEGPKNSSTISSNNDNGGTFAWSNPSNATASDNSYTSVTHTSAALSQYLKATNFNFNAVNGTINGIVVEIEKKRVTGFGWDDEVLIVQGGFPTGDNFSAGGYWPISEGYVSYGSPTELWGVSWNASDITSSSFGVVISYQTEGASLAYIDHIRITVYYTTTSGVKRRAFSQAGTIESSL